MKTRKNSHPSLDITGSHGTELAGKKIVLCVAGSVAAYKAIELARLLMRHGGNVTCVASGAALKLIKPDYLKWATGNKVVTKLTGDLEHVELADYNKSDLIIVYPATANTLGKMASGIDDTPVSTVLTVGLGSGIPIMVCPAMHASMYENAAVIRNIKFLKGKVDFVLPQITEGKAKAGEPEDILERILKKFGHSRTFSGKNVLITAGGTAERIDPVRSITNESTGKTGVLLAKEMLASGAQVTLVYGTGCEVPPVGVKCIRVKSAADMLKAIKKEMKKKFDIIIMAAAVSDYTIKPKKTKIKSGKKISLTLEPFPKIISRIRCMQKDAFLVGFKAEAGISHQELERRALRMMRESGADLVVANDIGSPRYVKNPNSNEIFMANRTSGSWSGWKSKEKLALWIRKNMEISFIININ